MPGLKITDDWLIAKLAMRDRFHMFTFKRPPHRGRDGCPNYPLGYDAENDRKCPWCVAQDARLL